MKQAEYKASRKEAKRCIARIQAEVIKKQAETLDSKEGRQNIFRIAKQKKKSRRGLVVEALDSHARGCGFKSCLAQDKDYWWGKVTGAHLHKCAHSPGHCPLWLGNRLRSKSSMPHKKKQKKKERKDITSTNCLKGDNGELLVSEEQVSGRWREYLKSY